MGYAKNGYSYMETKGIIKVSSKEGAHYSKEGSNPAEVGRSVYIRAVVGD